MTAPTQATAREAVEQIQKALELQPTRWDYDSNQTPFYNDAEGHSRGGDNDGTYCLYGPDFFIDGERYEGPVLADHCAKKDAYYIAACSPKNIRAVLALLAAKQEEVDKMREALKPFAAFACSPRGECQCHNCVARDLLALSPSQQGEPR